jgi:hypothetical protein
MPRDCERPGGAGGRVRDAHNVLRLDSLSGCSARMGAFGHSPFVRPPRRGFQKLRLPNVWKSNCCQ